MVDLDFETHAPPPLFSSTTKGAILAGCDLGALGMVRELVEKATLWPGFSGCAPYFAGGDSDYFAANIAGAENVGPDFTLLGVAAIFMENRG
jgi:pantothenate kinase type III